MKNIISLIIAALALAFTGCQQETPEQIVSTGIYAAGYPVAKDALTNNPTVLVQLQDVAAKLPHINDGSLTPGEYGTLVGEITNINTTIPALEKLFPADSDNLQKAVAFLTGAVASNASLNGGKAPTASQVLATTDLTDFANGIKDGIAYWQGFLGVPPLGK